MPAAVTKAKSKPKSKAPPSDGQVAPAANFLSFRNSSQTTNPQLSPFYSCGPVAGLVSPVQAKPAAVQRQAIDEQEPEQGNPLQEMLIQRQEVQDGEASEKNPPMPTKLIQRQEDEEPEEMPPMPMLVQRQEGEEPQEPPPMPMLIQRQEDVEMPETEPPDDSALNSVQTSAKSSNYAHSPAAGTATQGLRPAARPLPGFARIQNSFGHHDVSDVRVQVAGSARGASEQMGARAYTMGNRIAFKDEPGLKLAAHEAAHVVQQRRGIQLKSGIGKAGDVYEQQADSAADAVTEGRSAEKILDESPQGISDASPIQKAGCENCGKDEPVPIQHKLEINARRLSEPPAAVAGPAQVTSEQSETRVAEDEGTGAESEAVEGEEEEGGVEEAAEAAETEDSSSVAEAPSTEGAGGPSPGGGQVETSAAGESRRCEGGTEATCFDEDAERPAREPDEQPPNPEPTRVEEETSAGDEEELDEFDDCSDQGATETAAQAADSLESGETESMSSNEGETSEAGAASEGGATSAAGPAAEVPSVSMQSDNASSDTGIAQSESQRDEAVAGYETSSAELRESANATHALRIGIQFSGPPGSTEVATHRRMAALTADRLFSRAADRLERAIDYAAYSATDQLGAQAESAKSQLALSIETQKNEISARIAMARRHARADAAMARSEVNLQTETFISTVQNESADAIETLTTAHGDIMGQVNDLETSTLENVNAIYAEGRTTLEGLGTTVGDECTAIGNSYATTYRGFRNCRENGFWDGNLSQRRAAAQATAAHKVAEGYHDRMVESAQNRAREITRDGRKADRCSVIASASTARDTLDRHLTGLTAAIENVRDSSVEQAGNTRAGLISSIDGSLATTLSRLDQQEHDQRQTVNDTGYMQQLLQEQLAHAGATSIQRSVIDAAATIQSTLFDLRTRLESNEPPDIELLEQAVSQVTRRLDTAFNGLQSSVEGGTSLAIDELLNAANSGFEALEAVTQSNDEQATSLSGGFTASMSEMAGTDHFASQRDGFNQQIRQSTTSGIAALNSAIDAMRQGCDRTTDAAQTALVQAATQLEANLRQSKEGIECEIVSKADEAASKEAPAWKRALAVLLVIIVIVIVIAVTVATAGGALAALGPIATIAAGVAIGAAVGAVTSGLLAMAGNLWSNQDVMQGVGQAMLVGLVTGAIGGGIGAGVGLALKGFSLAVQYGAALVTAGGLDVVTQYVMGGFSFDNFSWSNLGMTMLITVLTLGLAHRVSTRAAARGAPTSDAPEPAPRTDAPEPAPRGDAPEPAPRGDVPEPAPRGDAPEPASRGDAPEPAPRADVPEPAPRGDAPEPAPRADAPEPAPPADAPEPAPRADAPEPAPPADAPEPAPRTDAPEPSPRTDAPEPVPTTDAPEPVPSTDAPEPVPTPDAPEPVPRPWEQGRNPMRYQRYVRNLQRRIRAGKTSQREPLGPEEWWNQHGSKPPRNPHGGEGTPAHRAVNDNLVAKAQAEYPPPRYQVRSNQRVPGLNRKPDAAVIDTTTGRVVKIYEAARFNRSGRLVRPDERAKITDYEGAGIPYEFHPVGPNKPPGGVLKSDN